MLNGVKYAGALTIPVATCVGSYTEICHKRDLPRGGFKMDYVIDVGFHCNCCPRSKLRLIGSIITLVDCIYLLFVALYRLNNSACTSQQRSN